MRYVMKWVVIAVVVVMLFGSAAPALAGEPIPPKNGEQYVVGIMYTSLAHPFILAMQELIQPEAEAQGVKLLELDSQEDVGKQMSQIEDLIQQDVDLLLIAAIDAEAMVAGVEAANAAGVPVVVYDRDVAGAEYISFIGGDNVAMGSLAANYIATKLYGKGKVVEIEGRVGSSPAIDRGSGFNEVMDRYPEIEVVFRQTGAFERAKGMEVMENVLQSGAEFDAVFCHNDEMAGGAREALAGHGLLGEVILVGVDQQADALQAIKDGEMAADILNPPAQAQERHFIHPFF